MAEELKEKIATVSDQLQNVMNSRATIDKLVQTGAVVLVEVLKEKVEGVDPAQLSINSPELIERMLNPVIRELDGKRNGLLNLKTGLLNQLEVHLTGPAKAEKPAVTGSEKVEKPAVKKKVKKEKK